MTLTGRLKSGWNALKVVRVLLGILVLYSSMAENNTTGIILGALFTIFSLFTDGVCCVGGNCQAPVKKDTNSLPENIEYEELGHK